MLRDLLVHLATDPDTMRQFRENRTQLLNDAGLSADERKAIETADAEKLRNLLHAELAGDPAGIELDAASEYEVYNVPTTPHCPVNQTSALDASYYTFTEPQHLWDNRGLTIVGMGIRGGLQTTAEARASIEQASKVLYLVADFVSGACIRKLNSTAESLQGCYQKGKSRMEIYEGIVQRILSCLHETDDLCVVFYGHPGVFVYPAREAIRRARIQGFNAKMLPGVSADANLFADLGIDPGIVGMQSYEATSFLINKHCPDTSAGLILWQIGVLGETRWDPPHKVTKERLQLLADYLSKFYGAEQNVVLYECAELPAANASIRKLCLAELPNAQVSGISTLYIPPKAQPSPDVEMVKKLKVEW